MWRAGIDVGQAVAVFAIVVSPESFATATRNYGWSLDDVEEWWHKTLTELLLR